MAYDKIEEVEEEEEEKKKKRKGSQYFDPSARRVLLLRSDLCWTCKRSQGVKEMQGCKILRYRMSTPGLESPSLCRALRYLERFDLKTSGAGYLLPLFRRRQRGPPLVLSRRH